MNIFDLPVLSAVIATASSALAGLGGLVTPALAIVLVTLIVRAALVPVGISTARAERGRRRVAPKLAELQKRFTRDPQRLQKETLALYASEKVSPFAGMLPVLAQAPVLTLVYALFASPTIAGAPNGLLDATLWGESLGRHVTAAVAAIEPADAVLLGLVVLLAVIAWVSRWVAMRVPPMIPGQPATASTLTRVLSWMPFVTVIAACFVPLAAGLYLLVSSAWSLGERVLLRRVITDAT